MARPEQMPEQIEGWQQYLAESWLQEVDLRFDGGKRRTDRLGVHIGFVEKANSAASSSPCSNQSA